MISFDGSKVHISFPDFSTLGMWDWILVLLTISAVYGLVTHLVSLPAINRHNDAVRSDCKARTLTPGCLIVVLLFRMTCQLWGRILCLCIGIIGNIIGIPVLLVATGRIHFWNRALVDGWRWYYEPKDLWEVSGTRLLLSRIARNGARNDG